MISSRRNEIVPGRGEVAYVPPPMLLKFNPSPLAAVVNLTVLAFSNRRFLLVSGVAGDWINPSSPFFFV